MVSVSSDLSVGGKRVILRFVGDLLKIRLASPDWSVWGMQSANLQIRSGTEDNPASDSGDACPDLLARTDYVEDLAHLVKVVYSNLAELKQHVACQNTRFLGGAVGHYLLDLQGRQVGYLFEH